MQDLLSKLKEKKEEMSEILEKADDSKKKYGKGKRQQLVTVQRKGKTFQRKQWVGEKAGAAKNKKSKSKDIFSQYGFKKNEIVVDKNLPLLDGQLVHIEKKPNGDVIGHIKMKEPGYKNFSESYVPIERIQKISDKSAKEPPSDQKVLAMKKNTPEATQKRINIAKENIETLEAQLTHDTYMGAPVTKNMRDAWKNAIKENKALIEKLEGSQEGGNIKKGKNGFFDVGSGIEVKGLSRDTNGNKTVQIRKPGETRWTSIQTNTNLPAVHKLDKEDLKRNGLPKEAAQQIVEHYNKHMKKDSGNSAKESGRRIAEDAARRAREMGRPDAADKIMSDFESAHKEKKKTDSSNEIHYSEIKTLTEFQDKTALLPDVVAETAAEDRNKDDKYIKRFQDYYADRILKLYNSSKTWRKKLDSANGRQVAHTLANHWMDAIDKNGFDKMEAQAKNMTKSVFKPITTLKRKRELLDEVKRIEKQIEKSMEYQLKIVRPFMLKSDANYDEICAVGIACMKNELHGVPTIEQLQENLTKSMEERDYKLPDEILQKAIENYDNFKDHMVRNNIALAKSYAEIIPLRLECEQLIVKAINCEAEFNDDEVA